LFIFEVDKMSSNNSESEAIILRAEEIATRLEIAAQLNQLDPNPPQINVTAGNVQGIYKYSAKNIYSGVSLTLTVETYDTIRYCPE
jgi:hypothetical protein